MIADMVVGAPTANQSQISRGLFEVDPLGLCTQEGDGRGDTTQIKTSMHRCSIGYCCGLPIPAPVTHATHMVPTFLISAYRLALAFGFLRSLKGRFRRSMLFLFLLGKCYLDDV